MLRAENRKNMEFVFVFESGVRTIVCLEADLFAAECSRLCCFRRFVTPIPVRIKISIKELKIDVCRSITVWCRFSTWLLCCGCKSDVKIFCDAKQFLLHLIFPSSISGRVLLSSEAVFFVTCLLLHRVFYGFSVVSRFIDRPFLAQHRT